jgi:hypothetical protein
MIVPAGIGAALGDARDNILRWLARKKGIRVPSLLADTLVAPEAPPPVTERLDELVEVETAGEHLLETQ